MSQFAQPNLRTSEAYQFLKHVLPWPPDGKDNFMSLHWSYTGKDNKPAWWGAVYKDLDEMTRAAINKAHEAGIQGVYVCMASQRTALPKITRAGNNILIPSRLAANAAEHRSFYVDVDVKDGAYKSTADAIAAAKRFIVDAKLPVPNAGVLTGSGGFHLHWLLQRPISSAEWRPYAEALAAAVRQHGLIADTQCTVDSVRILRVPDTFNKKSGDAKPVVLMRPIDNVGYPNAELFAALKPYLSAVQQSGAAPAVFSGVSPLPIIPADDLGAGIHREARPVHIGNVAKECPFVADALATGGKDYNEPQWNYTTLLAAFMVDGREAAHKMAAGHAEYTRESTDAKFTRKEHDKAQGVGWPQCRTISNVCSACQTCPHLAEGKSPLNWGHDPTEIDKQFSASDELPAGYVHDAQFRIWKTKIGEANSTEYIPISKYGIKDGWLQRNPWVLCFKTLIENKWEPVQMDFPVISDRRTLITALAVFGYSANSDQIKVVGDFLVAWIHKLQENKEKVLPAVAYGWLSKSGKTVGFTYAGNTYTPNGTRPAAAADHITSQNYKPHGEMQPWRDAVKVINDEKRPALDCIIACAFGAPLMHFTSQQGALISAYSIESGVGKTTAMKVAAAVWGDPVLSVQTLDDTHASVMNKVGAIRSLPLFWDEIKTDDDVARFVKIIFQITGGKERSRMTSNVTQRAVGTWETMALVCSNDTMIDEILKAARSTAAGIYRLFEFTVPPPHALHTNYEAVGRSIKRLNNNFGHAGEIYSKYLGENYAQAERITIKIVDDLMAACGGKQEERFWVVCAGTILAGAFLANQLKLTTIDLNALKGFLIQVFHDMRRARDRHSTDIANPRNIEELLSTYMNFKRYKHTLWTNCMIPNKPGRPRPINKNVDFVPLPPTDTSRLEALEIHIAKKDATMRMAMTPFREWIGKACNLKPTTVVDYLVKEYSAQIQLGVRLGGGTAFATGGMTCIEIAFSGTRLSDFIESLVPKDEL